MNTVTRRVSLCAVLGGALLGGATHSPAPTSAQSCDPAYVSHCVPQIEEVGDLDCQYFYDQASPTSNWPLRTTTRTASMGGTSPATHGRRVNHASQKNAAGRLLPSPCVDRGCGDGMARRRWKTPRANLATGPRLFIQASRPPSALI